MIKKGSLISYQKLAEQAVNSIGNPRSQKVLELRFGLKNGQRQTLEAIGQKYGITRERVRQVEEAAFYDLRKMAEGNLFQPAFKMIDHSFNQFGRLIKEEKLFSELTGQGHPHPERGGLLFVLTLGRPYQHLVESEKFHPLWINSPDVFNKVDFLIDDLNNCLAKENQALPLNNLANCLKEKNLALSKKALVSYLEATKLIDQDNFGYYGLSKWPQINPRGVKDKAYIILKQKNQPLHFRELTGLINQSNSNGKQARPQTVHNELIKDGRFVLVGRGTYALGEWGYQPGTIRQLVSQLLKENGPLTKEEIVEQILKNRLVKKNTVLINLQNKEYFKKNKDNKYLNA